MEESREEARRKGNGVLNSPLTRVILPRIYIVVFNTTVWGRKKSVTHTYGCGLE